MILIITFFIICLNVKTQIYAKYKISHNFDIANIELDRTKPTIQIIKKKKQQIYKITNMQTIKMRLF